jgi:hypothetical protein
VQPCEFRNSLDNTIRFIHNLDRARNVADISYQLLRHLGEIGAEHVIAGTFPSDQPNRRTQLNRALFNSWPNECNGRPKERPDWEIGEIMSISEHGTDKHLRSVRSKLGAMNRTQAVAEAIRRGFGSLPSNRNETAATARSYSAIPVVTRGATGSSDSWRLRRPNTRPFRALQAAFAPIPEVTLSSMIAFHPPHESHRPSQRWLAASQFWQTRL